MQCVLNDKKNDKCKKIQKKKHNKRMFPNIKNYVNIYETVSMTSSKFFEKIFFSLP